MWFNKHLVFLKITTFLLISWLIKITILFFILNCDVRYLFKFENCMNPAAPIPPLITWYSSISLIISSTHGSDPVPWVNESPSNSIDFFCRFKFDDCTNPKLFVELLKNADLSYQGDNITYSPQIQQKPFSDNIYKNLSNNSNWTAN